MVWVALVPLVLLVVLVVGATVFARRQGYAMGGDIVVRCSEGHLFTTIWIPFASFKAIRLGWVTFQRCPVGNHWAFVTSVRDQDLTDSRGESPSSSTTDRFPSRAEGHEDARQPLTACSVASGGVAICLPTADWALRVGKGLLRLDVADPWAEVPAVDVAEPGALDHRLEQV